VILSSRLVKELIFISQVVELHLFLHLCVYISVEPIFGTFLLICLINNILMLIFDMLNHKIITFEIFIFFAYFAFEDLFIVSHHLFTLIATEIVDILIDKFLSWINKSLGPLFDSFNCLTHIFFQKCDTSSPF